MRVFAYAIVVDAHGRRHGDGDRDPQECAPLECPHPGVASPVASTGAEAGGATLSPSSSILTIAAGATTSDAIIVTAADNGVDEADGKVFTISAEGVSGVSRSLPNRTLTVNKDDPTPTVTATPSGKSRDAVTVSAASSVGTTNDFTLSTVKTLTIAAGRRRVWAR